MGVPGMDGVLQGLGQVAGSITNGVSEATSDFVNSSSGMTRQAMQGVGFLTGTDPLGWAQDRDVQQDANRRRDDLYAERDAAGYTGRYDGSSVHMENFDGMSHEEIKARLDSATPVGILEDCRMWRAAADRLQQSVSTFTGEIASAIGSGWEGEAAGRASSGVSGYATGAADLQRAAVLIANKIEEAHSGIDQAKRRMPEPESTNVLDLLRSGIVTDPIGGVQRAFHKSEEARQEAIQVMKTEYAPVVQQADSQVPVLPPPHNPVVPPYVPPAGRPVDIGGPGSGTGQWASPAEREPVRDRANSELGRPGDDGGPDDRETAIDPAVARSGADGIAQGGAADGAGTPFAGEAVTRAASADASGGPGSAGFGTGGGGAGGTGGGSGAGGGAGTASGGGLAPGSGGLGGIGSGAGSGSGSGAGRVAAPGTGVGGAPAAGASGAGAGAAAGRPGAPGMGAMAPGGARSGGDDDTEHKTPGYLISVQNGSELIGDLPKVAPPVLGG
ncbi:WXG100 family type VII secretion target [Rhodococcus sp. NPDC058514]|uniref:WXG100 family type VII secretion target n=1 Tax=unclassified Rhodococcus (in: high G+C Gram-positive bacteria) TaxID=192944 RepID=UPI0036542068